MNEHSTTLQGGRLPSLFTVQQAAQMLQVSPVSVFRWAYSDRIKTIKIGKCRRIPSSEIARITLFGLDGHE